ncbi:uncharacterized protein LOC110418704 [Herrania umbratica]|uniref:Uncharacterized protein LOC110418704 n=1 Tax=Herrania umbratica TaxID=108875 RepID=A0A6J1AJS2_9ROSI|nr:uncharacterized protein LOC110418704 [Herrania umbratica]
MDDDKVRTRMKKMKRRYATATPALLRAIGFLGTMVLLLWTICCGFQLTMEPWLYTAVAARAFHVGVTTMVFGFLFLILGLSILAGMVLDISEHLPKLSGTRQGQETRTISKAIAKALMTVITTLIIMWAMYTGFRLATESEDSKHYLLTVSIGVTTILFGLIYFVIGLAIVLGVALDFWTRSQQKEKQETSFHHCCNADAKCFP